MHRQTASYLHGKRHVDGSTDGVHLHWWNVREGEIVLPVRYEAGLFDLRSRDVFRRAFVLWMDD